MCDGQLCLFQCCNTFLERFDDTFSICLLLAFHLKNGGRSIIHTLLVTQFLQHTLQESFLMLQFGLQFPTLQIKKMFFQLWNQILHILQYTIITKALIIKYTFPLNRIIQYNRNYIFTYRMGSKCH